MAPARWAFAEPGSLADSAALKRPMLCSVLSAPYALVHWMMGAVEARAGLARR